MIRIDTKYVFDSRGRNHQYLKNISASGLLPTFYSQTVNAHLIISYPDHVRPTEASFQREGSSVRVRSARIVYTIKSFSSGTLID